MSCTDLRNLLLVRPLDFKLAVEKPQLCDHLESCSACERWYRDLLDSRSARVLITE